MGGQLTSGPPPKDPDQRRRRNATPDQVILPADGRPGPAPTWPLAEIAEPAESALWVELWQKPQAFMWEQQHIERTVARYVRYVLAAEMSPLSPTPEVRHLEDRLGLNSLSMRRLGWSVAARPAGAPTGPRPVRKTTKGKSASSRRARTLRLIDGDGNAQAG